MPRAEIVMALVGGASTASAADRWALLVASAARRQE